MTNTSIYLQPAQWMMTPHSSNLSSATACSAYSPFCRLVLAGFSAASATQIFKGISLVTKHSLIGGSDYFLFFHMLGIIIPIDFHTFQKGRYTTNQYMDLTHLTKQESNGSLTLDSHVDFLQCSLAHWPADQKLLGSRRSP